MDAKRKSMLIDEAEKKYAELIKELEFIKKSDSEFFDVKGPDKLCMFREENVMWARENVFSPYDFPMSLYPKADGKIHSYMLYSFKYRADEHVCYVLETITEQEPLVLPSGRLSKNKTEDKKYYVVASYNFYSGNIEVNVLDASVSMTPLMKFRCPEDYYILYKRTIEASERERRNKPLLITVGMWEDMQNAIQRLDNLIKEHAKDVFNNYERRYNSEEE